MREPPPPSYRPYIAALAILLTLLFIFVTRWVLSTLRPKNFPLGPPVVPGLGNILQVPARKPYLRFHEWAGRYGDLFSLKAGAGNLVVINSPAVVHELFDRRGAIYSGRPVSHVLTKHIWYGPEDKAAAVLQYDSKTHRTILPGWRSTLWLIPLSGYYQRWRKTFQYILSTAGTKRILPLLETEACNLCQRLLDDKADYQACLRAWALGVPLAATSGRRLDDMPPGYADAFFQSQADILKLSVPGAVPPVDVFPILRYVPEFLAGWKTDARRLRRVMLQEALGYLENGKRQYAKVREDPGSVRLEGLIAKVLREQDSPGATRPGQRFTDLELGHMGRDFIGATVDTTSATFESLMCCFAAFPDVLERAQEEVDRVAGGRPPTGGQIGELVYLKACISEVSISTPALEDRKGS